MPRDASPDKRELRLGMVGLTPPIEASFHEPYLAKRDCETTSSVEMYKRHLVWVSRRLENL